MNWDIELIPDEDNLFLRIHGNLLRFDFDFTKKKVPINVFRIHNEGISKWIILPKANLKK